MPCSFVYISEDKRRNIMKRFIAMIFIVVSALVFISCNGSPQELVEPDGNNVGAFVSYQQLGDYLKKFYQESSGRYFSNEAIMGMPEASAQDDGVNFDSGDRDYSKTNNQTDGVEEADTIMTDGYYIYITSGNRFLIFDAVTLEIVYQYEAQEIYFEGLYLYQDRIVLIGSYYTYMLLEQPNDDTIESEEGEVFPYYYDYYYYSYNYGAKIIVLDKSDMENIEVARELVFDSSYITSSRMVDGNLYLVMNNYTISYYFNDDNFIPKYMDSVKSSSLENFEADQIYFMPNDSENFSYLILASFDVTDDEEADVKAYLGSSYQIYMSANNLYTTVYKYHYDYEAQIYSHSTFILRFSIDEGQLNYQAFAQIKGSPLNQFSMDEYEGVFRIAVTDYEFSQSGTITNNKIYLLDSTTDEEMELISELGGLGKPGERIYAVRYINEIAYVVTFVNTDPLYKLDLSDPKNPEVLGELYEEGVSDYLHPITDNLMIGIGRQAETNEYGWTNFVGVKIALYDTSEDEVVNLETYLVEGEYSYSAVTYSHKAFVYFAPQGEEFTYIAVPVSIYYNNYYRYSQKMFVFKVHYSGDLELVAQLEHFNSESSHFDSIEKAVMIENYIYTLSYSQIQVFDMNNNFEFVDSVVFNQMYYSIYDYTEVPIGSTETRSDE